MEWGKIPFPVGRFHPAHFEQISSVMGTVCTEGDVLM